MNRNPLEMAHVTEGRVRVSPLRHLPDLLEGFGVALAPLLDHLGLPARILDDPENTIAVTSAAQLLELCATRSRCAHFGLLLGQRASLGAFGLIGARVRNEANVGAALHALARTQHLHGRAGVPAVVVKDDVALYSLTLEGYLGLGASHVHDLSAAMGFNLMRELCGATWIPTEVLLPHKPPVDRRPYDRCFQAPVRFDAEWTALAFPARWLSHPVRGADALRLGRLQQSVEEVAARHHNDLIMLVRRALYVLVMQGRGSVEDVSCLIGMHRRTINRRLALRGTSISRLQEEVKSQIARQLLTDTTMSMIEIASTLDYSDASAFTRAFRRWENTTPTAWRRALGCRSQVP